MNTVIIGVASRDEVAAAFVRAWQTGKRARAAYITFETLELLWTVLTAKRWELIEALMGVGPLGVRELARRVGRDVRGVHSDVTALGRAGVIDRTDDGKVLFPYKRVDVRFTVRAGG